MSLRHVGQLYNGERLCTGGVPLGHDSVADKAAMDELYDAQKDSCDWLVVFWQRGLVAQLKFHASCAVLPGNEIWRSFGADVVLAPSLVSVCFLEMPARLLRVKVSLSLPSRRPSTILSSMASRRAMTQYLI